MVAGKRIGSDGRGGRLAALISNRFAQIQKIYLLVNQQSVNIGLNACKCAIDID